ncbi:LOW QUALITY PROTEIN: hypothetical protein U9M48_037871 [Paspalum notatum var. saurae]|uniref:Uncharacterized protein n=1 Tax=Paspalum notatum var. saurae TaxID=547442 RepID=A0AAQ3UGY0_PASNO
MVAEEIVVLSLCNCSSMLVVDSERVIGVVDAYYWQEQLTSASVMLVHVTLAVKVGVWPLYKVRVFRRETLLWISVLNKAATPLSTSAMSNSNTCNCSSLHSVFFFWNALDTSNHLLALGIAICFERRCDVDSSIDTTISLASANNVTTLHPSMPEVALLLIFLYCFCAFLAKRALNLGLKSRIISSLENQLHPLDGGLELSKGLLHDVAEVQQDKRALELLLYCLPLQMLVAGQACELVNAAVDAHDLVQAINYGFNGH